MSVWRPDRAFSGHGKLETLQVPISLQYNENIMIFSEIWRFFPFWVDLLTSVVQVLKNFGIPYAGGWAKGFVSNSTFNKFSAWFQIALSNLLDVTIFESSANFEDVYTKLNEGLVCKFWVEFPENWSWKYLRMQLVSKPPHVFKIWF